MIHAVETEVLGRSIGFYYERMVYVYPNTGVIRIDGSLREANSLEVEGPFRVERLEMANLYFLEEGFDLGIYI